MSGEPPHHAAQSPPVRVLVADDEPIIRSALEELIATDPRLEFVGAAANAEEAIAQAQSARPDVVLLDVRMPAGGGPRAAAEIDALPDPPTTVAFSAYDDRSAILSMLEAGACGYLVKGSPNADILETLVRAARVGARRERPDPPAPAARPSAGSSTVRVLVADEPGAARDAMSSLIEGRPEFELAGVASNAAEALRLACIHRPHAVLVGHSLPGGSTSAIREVRQAVPAASMLAYAPDSEPRGVREAVQAGAMSYLVAADHDEEIITAVHEAVRGRSTLSPAAASAVVRELSVTPVARREHRRHSRRRAQLERFIRGEGLGIALQPIIDLRSGESSAFEALARFDDVSGQGPSVWFAWAAEEGLGSELELAAVRAAVAVIDALPDGCCLSINVSPHVAASPRLVEALADAPLERLVLELTEHAVVEDYDALGEAFTALRHRGVRIAVDDAGAGFASLRHVLLIEPDYLKLDISLCAGVARDRRRRALARALLAFAGETEIQAVAEGIETAEDLTVLRELGVELAQGFYLGAPAPVAV